MKLKKNQIKNIGRTFAENTKKFVLNIERNNISNEEEKIKLWSIVAGEKNNSNINTKKT